MTIAKCSKCCRFTFSDDAYHKLRTVSNLPLLYQLKQFLTTLNNSLKLNRFDGPYPETFLEALNSKAVSCYKLLIMM